MNGIVKTGFVRIVFLFARGIAALGTLADVAAAGGRTSP